MDVSLTRNRARRLTMAPATRCRVRHWLLDHGQPRIADSFGGMHVSVQRLSHALLGRTRNIHVGCAEPPIGYILARRVCFSVREQLYNRTFIYVFCRLSSRQKARQQFRMRSIWVCVLAWLYLFPTYYTLLSPAVIGPWTPYVPSNAKAKSQTPQVKSLQTRRSWRHRPCSKRSRRRLTPCKASEAQK